MTYESETGEELVGKLPAIFPRDDESGNYKLFQVFGHGIDDTKEDLDAVDNAVSVQSAETVAQLEELAHLVDVNQKNNENREKFRSRVIAKHQLVTGEASIGNILSAVGEILGISVKDIKYSELDEDHAIRIGVPKSSIDSAELNEEELAGIIQDLAMAGGSVYSLALGTLEYVSPATYADCEGGTDSWSNYEGYDGTDTNGDPKGNGGTYSGVLN